jgi:hypothetical protein
MKSCFVSFAAVALVCAISSVSSAGVIALRLETVDPKPTEITVGDAVRVSVSLDGLGDEAAGIWAVRVGVPEGFTTPSEIEFPRSPVIHGFTAFSFASATPATGFDAFVFPSLFSSPTAFSFTTTAQQPGTWTFDADGFAALFNGGWSVNFVAGLQDTLQLEVQPTSTVPLNAPPAPQMLSSPEPTSAAIFATLAGTLLLRRRRG